MDDDLLSFEESLDEHLRTRAPLQRSSTLNAAVDPERQVMEDLLTGNQMKSSPGVGIPPDIWLQHMREKQKHELKSMQIQVDSQERIQQHEHKAAKERRQHETECLKLRT